MEARIGNAVEKSDLEQALHHSGAAIYHLGKAAECLSVHDESDFHLMVIELQRKVRDFIRQVEAKIPQRPQEQPGPYSEGI